MSHTNPSTKKMSTKQLGITAKKNEDFSAWYTQVININWQVLLRSEMMDYYDVSGCYILRPWSFRIWKSIQNFFTAEIEKMGIEEAYFPMFVSKNALELEKDHVEGFAPEVAWVTKSGGSDMAEPIAIRPTSETIMYPAYSKWIQSHRDLPLRINQWCNVVRWEFKHPQPFLRTREFLWQEGHTVFLTKEEADQEVLQILDLYRRVYEDLLAIPVVKGKKSEKEKFAGGLYTTTVEAFIPSSGRAIQGATSHCLGQNFSKMFNIQVENENAEKVFCWQNSWGITTRTIGVMVMSHSDDQGLVLPPRVASIQVIVVPCGINSKTKPEDEQAVLEAVEAIVKNLNQGGIRAQSDVRTNHSSGWKFNHWEMKGVPIRLEVGPRDVKNAETRAVLRFDGSKQQLSTENLSSTISNMLETIHQSMFAKLQAQRDSHMPIIEEWDQVVPALDNKSLVLLPWCETEKCEELIKERTSRKGNLDEKAPAMGAKSLCIPFDQPRKVSGKCINCELEAKSFTLFGRSY